MTEGTLAVIDLFAGVGGLSLGAARAGFNVRAAVEIDPIALGTHHINFPNSTHLGEDVAGLSGARLMELANVSSRELAGIIGGPPCQGFSDMGLRSATDPRNELFVHFFRLVSECRPAFFVAENVPGVLSPRNRETVARALALVPSIYTVLPPIKVKASDYGVPTTRTRVFFIGFDRDRVSGVKPEDFLPSDPEDIRVRHALEGLTPLRAMWQAEAQSWRSVGTLQSSRYASRIAGHVPEGVGNSEALRLYRDECRVSGFLGTRHSDETIKRFRALAPGKQDPISKASRLDKAGYCPTLRAGTGPERGSYQAIRPVHPTSPRVISPREAARLQGFPDWFQFHPTKWHSFRQIGNSVSPMIAESILAVLAKASHQTAQR